MGSRGGKKKNVSIKITPEEQKKLNRKLWWQAHKTMIILILCGTLLIGGIIGVAVSQNNQ